MELLIKYSHREDDVYASLDVEMLVAHVLKREKQPTDCEVSISFVTDETIRQLNYEYRGIDQPTDVLSFGCDDEEDDEYDFPGILDDMPYELGDIFIAPDIAERQAAEHGIMFGAELSLLVCHGLLHLCGYDHVEEEEAKVMEAREQELLSEFWARPFERTAAKRSDA